MPRRRRLEPSEAQVLKAVLETLCRHPKVAFAYRQNAGAMFATSSTGKQYFMRMGPSGISDIVGMTRDGRYLAVECKAPSGTLKPNQALFLRIVTDNGGVAFVARSVEDVMREMAALTG